MRVCACVCACKALCIVPAVFVLGGTLFLQFTPWAQKSFLLFLSAGFVSEWTNSTTLEEFVSPSTELLRVCCLTCSAFTDCKGNLLFVKSQQSQLCPSLRGEGAHHGPRAPVVVEATSC